MRINGLQLIDGTSKLKASLFSFKTLQKTRFGELKIVAQSKKKNLWNQKLISSGYKANPILKATSPLKVQSAKDS